ncbi:hypothetical protein D8674_034861 [Pyrus ussuriensis x Pyrus communis]|uniref:Uncharacterized protein n=1 Tax=Pyrus ussuriensis x Pyrus communis TaxID=2448454 RepID=A0A5N5GAT1_9ROSA|nr:hypothetical protein D8674_034861 [Pyrus ussuriensis x Pyrus communis]
MNPRLVNPVGPRVSQVPAPSASLVALPISTKRATRCPCTPNITSASTTDALGSQPSKLKMAKVTRVTNERITIKYDDQHRAAPTMEQHIALAHDIGHVVQSYCHMQWKSWKAMLNEVRTYVCDYLSILTDTLDQTLGRMSGTYCKGIGNDHRREPRASSSSQSNGEVTTLTEEVADLIRAICH